MPSRKNSPRRPHGEIEDGAHGHPDHARPRRRVRPLGRSRQHVVQHVQHLPVVPDLLHPRRVLVVRRLLGYLVEHLLEVHVDARVGLDELPEVLEGGRELLRRVLGHVLGRPVQELAVDAVVRRQPRAWSGRFRVGGEINAKLRCEVEGGGWLLTCESAHVEGCGVRRRVDAPS